jgi:hypothetical protein
VALDVAPSGACTRHAEGGLVDGAACYSGLGLTAPAEQGVRSGSVQVTGMGTGTLQGVHVPLHAATVCAHEHALLYGRSRALRRPPGLPPRLVRRKCHA